MLTAKTGSYGWHVVDSEGGVWWPGDAAKAEIDAADDPEGHVISICETDTERGTWCS